MRNSADAAVHVTTANLKSYMLEKTFRFLHSETVGKRLRIVGAVVLLLLLFVTAAGCWAVYCSTAASVCCVSPLLWFMEICSWTPSPPTFPTSVSHVTDTCPIRELKPPPDMTQQADKIRRVS